jgi:2-desacetyl-2-hydroxyethyl bacteriochlorophyllide A dehydrogenase
MKAVRLIEHGHPLEMAEVPMPEIGPGDVLVRVKASGICHSDAHYRAGEPATPTPLTLGHEVAGNVERLGENVTGLQANDRVCLHYVISCGECDFCRRGSEQFCPHFQMLGNNRDGGYAEFVALPARNAFLLPDEVSFEHAAIMMCSSATCYHALRKSRMAPGEAVAIFGVGGLGISAVQLARAFGASDVYAIDTNPAKLDLAWSLGAIPINAAKSDPVEEIKRLTAGKGVDVAMELIGLPVTIQQSVRSLAVFGRSVLVGITGAAVEIAPYKELIGREAEIIGVADHLAQEIPPLLDLARRGLLDLSEAVTDTIPLDAGAINEALDNLSRYGRGIRTVIVP